MSTISVVTPSYNQGLYIDAAINSVLSQKCGRLEYVVIDGGSADNSVEVIRRYGARLHYWVSEPDSGQYAAINKGFLRTSGEIMAWLNSDDVYMPWALGTVVAIFDKFPQIEWLTTSMPLAMDAGGNVIKLSPVYGFTKEGFFSGDNLIEQGAYGTCFIQQESTFWRRSLWERAGGQLDEGYAFAADFDLWARFFKEAALYAVDIPLGCFRRHSRQKTNTALNDYLAEARKAFQIHGGRRRSPVLQKVRLKLRQLLPIASRVAAFRCGLMEPAFIVSYDSHANDWVIIRA